MDQRRSLLDGDSTPTNERANVFDDENEVEDFDHFDGVADGFGFRPNLGQDEREEGEPSVRTVSAHYAQELVTPTGSVPPSRTSTRKTRTYPNPFTSPEDGDHPTPRQSLEFEQDDMVRRSVSSASSSQFAPSHTPRFGAGPSHPYGIYPQGTMARTPSIATQSTTRPSGRQSYSQNRPTHPYAMYPQGVGDEMDDEDEDTGIPVRQNPVPVGFPGLGQNYTRRLGPDGEDQDIIGEDGHTEQLPPYSRYPEAGPEKVPLLVPTALHSRAPVAGTDPAMPLMHHTILPSPTTAPQSMSDESTLVRQSTRDSAQNLLPSSSSSRGSSVLKENKAWNEKTWKEKRKTKFCGVIPCWWILLAVGIFAFVGAVLGGVIGGFVAGGKHAREESSIVVTSYYDASPIASPTSGAPPTGTFALTLGAPEETQCNCLPNDDEKVAWDCNIAPNSLLGIQVALPPNNQGLGARIFDASEDNSVAYGAQLNYMNSSFAQFLTVQDNDDPANGPAFYFQQVYDKVVVVPEAAIQPNNKKHKAKREPGVYHPPPGWRLSDAWQQRKQVANPGERPWFCVWNGTFLEGFIYITETLSSTTTSTSINSTSPTPPISPSLPPPVSATSTAAAASSSSQTYPAGMPTAPPSIITTTATFSMATTTAVATYTGPAAGLDAWYSSLTSQEQYGNGYHSAYGNGGGYKKRGIPGDGYWESLPLFPYLVKLEERRVPNSPNPYCQQFQILDNHSVGTVVDDDGNPIMVELEEKDPSFGAYVSAGVASTSDRKRGTVAGECHCQWISGQT